MGIESGLSHEREPTAGAASGASASWDRDSAPVRVSGPVVAVLLAALLVFAVALGTRLIGLGGAVTEDEDQWIARSGAFARGLATGEWRRTYQTGHPGVTTMWITTITLGLPRTAPFERPTGAPDVTTLPDFLPALQAARVPFAVLQAGLATLAAFLAGRLLGAGVGLIAGLLLAAEPFWAGVGPVVGMDGLLTGFLTVALLALLLAARPTAAAPGAPCSWPERGRDDHLVSPARSRIVGPRERLGWAVLAGLAFGLAFLTKTTALFAAPLVPALALLSGWQQWRHAWAEPAGAGAHGRSWLGPLLLAGGWGVAAGLTVWLVWPAAWASPVGTVLRAIDFSARLGGTPHGPGSFLLGQPVADPGPLFYPVALALRLGPGTTVGLLLLFVFGAAPAIRRPAWVLLGFVLLFLVLLMVAAKKVDRYLLPILPALGVLAAVGWYEAGRWAAPRMGRPPGDASRLLTVVAAGLALVLQAWPLVAAGRYPLAAYNPLFGGVRAAEQAIPVGWGDGLDLAGEQIREMAGGRTVATAIWSPLRVSFGAHAPGPVVSERQIGQADFYVDYVHARQRRLTPRELAGRTPDATVTIGGVEYARVFRLRR